MRTLVRQVWQENKFERWMQLIYPRTLECIVADADRRSAKTPFSPFLFFFYLRKYALRSKHDNTTLPFYQKKYTILLRFKVSVSYTIDTHTDLRWDLTDTGV